jgi:hypothetical protein
LPPRWAEEPPPPSPFRRLQDTAPPLRTLPLPLAPPLLTAGRRKVHRLRVPPPLLMVEPLMVEPPRRNQGSVLHRGNRPRAHPVLGLRLVVPLNTGRCLRPPRTRRRSRSKESTLSAEPWRPMRAPSPPSARRCTKPPPRRPLPLRLLTGRRREALRTGDSVVVLPRLTGVHRPATELPRARLPAEVRLDTVLPNRTTALPSPDTTPTASSRPLTDSSSLGSKAWRPTAKEPWLR